MEHTWLRGEDNENQEVHGKLWVRWGRGKRRDMTNKKSSVARTLANQHCIMAGLGDRPFESEISERVAPWNLQVWLKCSSLGCNRSGRDMHGPTASRRSFHSSLNPLWLKIMNDLRKRKNKIKRVLRLLRGTMGIVC